MFNPRPAYMPEEGVLLLDAVVFEVKFRLLDYKSIHVYGFSSYEGTDTVCSPIRSLKEINGYWSAITRSYNQYVFEYTNDRKVIDHREKAFRNSLLMERWLNGSEPDSVRILTIDDFATAQFHSGEPHESEKYLSQ